MPGSLKKAAHLRLALGTGLQDSIPLRPLDCPHPDSAEEAAEFELGMASKLVKELRLEMASELMLERAKLLVKELVKQLAMASGSGTPQD